MEQSVRCKGCNKIVKLSNRPERSYEMKNWNVHRETCSAITGVKTIQTARVVNKVLLLFSPVFLIELSDRLFVGS